MAKAPSGYVPLSMNYMRDPDIRRAGAEAEHLYIRSLAHSKAGATDGFIGDFDLDVVAVGMKSVARRVAALVRVGLWQEVEGGWAIRNWSKWNMTQNEIRDDKDRKRDAAIKTNHDRWHVPEHKTDPNCPHCTESLHRSVDRSTERVASGSLREEKRSEDREKTERRQRESEEKVVPPTAGVVASDAPATAQTLIAEWIGHCGARPPSRVIGQVSKEVGAMLTEGIDYDDVRAGLAVWHTKGLHPSTLASVVHEHRTRDQRGATRKESTTDARVRDGLALAERFSALDAEDARLALPQGEIA